MKAIHSALIKSLHEYAKKYQFQRAVIGLSGGLDSAVAFCIAVRAFGPQNVSALILPEVGLTPQEDIDHARALATHFGAEVHYQPINNFLVDFNFVTWDKSETSNSNVKARVRNTLIYNYANARNALVIGTANKSDLMIGYGVKHGEFTGDFLLLGDLYKSDVAELGKFIELPDELLSKIPSRQLKPYQSDESDLLAGWPKIDEILRRLDNGTDPETMIEKGIDALTVHKIVRLVQDSEHKRAFAPIPAVGKISESIKKAQEEEARTL
ncbi:NAD(+) synthase [Candidatus Peregrinibacteria bacterium]|nr:NAD(+) synthase [Candidatus Peregrinibacteria bacterium]